MGGTIRYIHRGAIREIADGDPTLTVLRYLREVAGLTGTKEGCAEGDCGACTIVLGERMADGAIRYQALNACILFVGALDGRLLLTVEDLQAADGTLHPVQQAMVDRHASQCGFCTPGFVMSLFALYRSVARPNRQAIADALSGNLCRCTGYRPIVDAGEAMYDAGRGDAIAARHDDDARLLAEIARGDTMTFTGRAFDGTPRRWFAPVSVDDLAELAARHPGGHLVAGATDVGLWVTKEHRALETVIYIGNVAELRTLEETGDAIDIGAAVTYTEALATLARHYPDLGELFRRLGGVPVRNAGTIGGNIANGSPIGDSPPPLIVLGATVVLRHGAVRRELPLEEFFLGYRETVLAPGEFVERIRVPAADAGRRFRTYKVSKRFDQDITGVLGAFCVALDERGRVAEARIAFGGMAATPQRAPAAEAALAGQDWASIDLTAAMAALDRDYAPITDFRASADYRQRVARNLLRKFWLETATAAPPATRVLEYA